MEVNPTKTIELIGYTAVVNGQPALSPTVDLGTENSYGVEYLQLKFDEVWGDLTITATFTAPDKTSTDVVVDINGLVEVPHEATCHGSGRGVIVFKGCRNGVQLISCDVGSFVTAHGPVNGSESAEPTPDKWQQFVDEVQDDREAANKAAQDAAASADRAEAAAENAENAAQTAADAAGVAGQAANAANESVKAAQTAQGSAESAAQSAAGSARAAADSAAAAKKSAEDAAASSKSAASKAEESASSASAAAKNAKAAQTAQGSAENAAQTAADAAGVARQAAGVAGSAAEAASTSAGEAVQSAKAAETAKQIAEDAAKKALEAKTGSENALRDADAAKNAASGYADAAAKSATAAATSEKKAAKSANSAADSAAAAKKSADDADNTANSIKDSMTQISENKEAVSKLKEDTAALKKHQNVLAGSETGNPVSCNDAYSAPLCGLTVYGKSTQDGTPTTDAPVPIVSAGDGGSVVVKVTGKNLLDFLHASITVLGWTSKFTRSDDTFTARAINGWGAFGFVSPFPGKQISVSLTYRQTDDKTVDVNDAFSVYTGPSVRYPNNETVSLFTMKSPSKEWEKATGTAISKKYIYLFLKVANEGVGEERTIEVKDFQLELGSDSTAYSPYREQLLTLQTPNGLPGIPVTSGGNYTDQNGQQWVCDEVDLERGVKVQRIDKSAFDSTKTLAEQNATLATPIEIPLTPAEIAAYKAITAYAPDTVVQASDGAGIKLYYQRDVNLVVKNLEDAIASMTTT